MNHFAKLKARLLFMQWWRQHMADNWRKHAESKAVEYQYANLKN
jgi:hypothetical protein